jgi:hypothetical protein
MEAGPTMPSAKSASRRENRFLASGRNDGVELGGYDFRNSGKYCQY